MPRLHGWGVGLAVLLCAGVAACGGYKNGYFVKDSLRYRVAALDEAQWKRVEFSGNDLAWVHPGSAHVLAMNATCEDHGDPPLEVLTNHLLFGFTDRQLSSRTSKVIDSRAALVSHYLADLDGVPVELTLVVLKKDGCVHDFIYVAPKGHAEEQRAAFDQLLSAFTVEKL